LRGLIGKNDTFHTNVQINGPKLVWAQEYVWAITKVIFNYTGSLGEKIQQKGLGALLFFDSHCRDKIVKRQ